MRMFAPAMRRNRGNGAFDQFQQRLLDAFAGNIAGNRRAFGLARYLVYLVNIDYSGFGFFNFIVAGL